MNRVVARSLAIALLSLVPVAASRAQAPAPPPHAAASPRDTTHLLPPWLRGWAEFGGGWMSAPAYLKRHYESGQAFALGLEARPGRGWALRTALDYQMLLAQNNTDLTYTYRDAFDPSIVHVDTLHFQSQTTGWILGSRTEAGVRLPGEFWLTAGAGGGYMRSGLSGVETDMYTGYPVITSGAVENGWGWLWTAALRYDFMPAPRVPLGIDVRTQSLERGHDTVRTWSVRVCFRMPEDAPPGAPRTRR